MLPQQEGSLKDEEKMGYRKQERQGGARCWGRGPQFTRPGLPRRGLISGGGGRESTARTVGTGQTSPPS